MKGLSAGLTFVNFSTICAVLLGIVAGGLGLTSAVVSLAVGAGAAIAAYFTTIDPEAKRVLPTPPEAEISSSKRAQRRLGKTEPESATTRNGRYRSVWFWLLAVC